jgi:DNA ligase D
MASAREALREYNRKRDFAKTAEPRGRAGKAAAAGRKLYLIQKHDATRLHYDFRLELEGVLKSWAVTRGPSLDPADKRLAVRTEDHPLAYGAFEGTIPKKEYGGGTVMLWDTGWWEPDGDPTRGLKEGKLKFRLHGARLTGAWALVRMRGKSGEKRENWLLIKEHDDEVALDGDAILEREVTSITTGRTMDEIAAGKGARGGRVWHSNRSADENVRNGAVAAAKASPKKPKARSNLLERPRFVAPQLATLVAEAPESGEWLNEAKYDGYRLMIAVGKGGAICYTRSGLDWSEKFPSIAEAVEALPCRSALIDGEAVADGAGSKFSALQQAIKSGSDISFYAFDLLNLDGEDLSRLPLTKRKEKLRRLLGKSDGSVLRFSEHVTGHGAEVFAQLCPSGQEGMIAKRADDRYRSGRAGGWLKIKCTKRQEFVIGGYSPSDKKGRPFASLLVGTFEDGRLVYRGRVGSGFREETMADLAARFASRIRKTSPFTDVPREFARGAKWLRPDLVAEIDFAEFTDGGHIRHGVFEGLRKDKEAGAVTLETAKKGSPGGKRSGSKAKEGKLAVAGVAITHPDRVVFPDAGVTKGDLARYYGAVAERFLAHAGGHPVSLVRCPQGDIAHCFFQKHAGEGFPDAIRRVPIKETSGKSESYMALDTADDVVSAVQMGTIEFHIWGSSADSLEKPDRIVFDLDPDPSVGFDAVVRSAIELRAVLETVGLKSLAMVTGGKGVHVVVPLARRAGWDAVKSFAKGLAGRLADAAPDRYTATMSKAKRKGKIFIDWLRNERGSTAIAPYSVRARAGAPVAVPVSWEELEKLDRANGFSLEEALARLEKPDPWREASGWRQSVTKPMLDAIAG